MSNTIKVLARVECANCECKRTETMPAEVKACIGDGGRIEVDIAPEYPEKWLMVRTSSLNVDGVWLTRGDVVCAMCAVAVRSKLAEEELVQASKPLRQGKRVTR